jgi:microcystin-dependent protein
MSNPYIGEIRMFGGNYAPNGWAFCNGALLAIAENDALFALIGTTFGGDGQTTFALPDLRGRAPVHMGQGLSNYVIGQAGGSEQVTLNANQIQAHTHAPLGQTAAGSQTSPAGGVWAASTLNQYSTNAPSQPLNPAVVQTSGGSQPHDNMMPYLAINFIISLFGIFPSQS